MCRKRKFNNSEQRSLWSLLAFKVDGCGAGTSLAGGGLDRIGRVIACARGPGYGPPLRDHGPLTEGNDWIFFFHSTVVVQRMQPPLSHTIGTSTPTAASTTNTTSATAVV